MAITVEQVLGMKPLSSARLLAGNSGIAKEIKFVNIMEVPGVVKWLKGGELLLTSGYVLKENPDLLNKIVYDLAEKGVSALCIKPGQFFQQVPENLIVDANNVGLPLLEIPSSMPYSDIMLAVFDVIINQQYSILKKSQAVHEQLFDLLLRGRSFNDIAHLMTKMIGNPVLIIDCSGNVLGPSSQHSNADLIKHVQRYFYNNPSIHQSSNFFHGFKQIYIKADQRVLQGLLFSLKSNHVLSGYILVIEETGPLTEQDIMAIHQGAAITALEFSKTTEILEAERRLGSELLEDLIFGRISDTESLIHRASFLNFTIEQEKVVFILKLNKYEDISPNRLENIKLNLIRYTSECFTNYPGGSLLSRRSDRLIGMVGVQKNQHLLTRLEQLAAIIKNKHGKEINCCIGVGNCFTDISDAKESYQQAELAVSLYDSQKDNIIRFEEIESLKLFYDLKGEPVLKEFCESTLAPIISYDQKNNSELLKTLDAFFRNDSNILKTADELYIHKNTVTYRLHRIEKLTGHSLKNVEHKLNLQIAMKAKILYKFNA